MSKPIRRLLLIAVMLLALAPVPVSDAACSSYWLAKIFCEYGCVELYEECRADGGGLAECQGVYDSCAEDCENAC